MYNKSQAAITEWYKLNKRMLPWRQTKSAYHIWLSEVILQQTRVQQGLPYYNKFIKAFPKVEDLAQATESDVLLLWQGLGYYSRARNMHFTAKIIVEKYKGIFPNTYEEIKNLKGVGEYTAAAIASFAFDLPYPAIDGNVMRVISRIFGVEEDIMLSHTKKVITDIASEMMHAKDAALFNQSMMEFGALQCKAKNPNCNICPLLDICFAYHNNKVKELPLKINKTKVKNRYFNYLIIKGAHDKLFIQKREQKDIWQNLYQFPLIESSIPLSETALLDEIKNQMQCKTSINLRFRSLEIKHKLSHQLLHIHFNIIQCKGFLIKNNWELIRITDWDAFPFPEIINKNKSFILENL